MFAAGAAAPIPVTEIAIARPVQPGVGVKDTTPVFAKLHVQGFDITQGARLKTCREFFAGLLLPDHPSLPVLLRVVKASPLARLRRMQESSLANRGSCS